MEIVENTLDTEIDAVLSRPLFCFLGQASDGGPRLSPLWFLWEDRQVWCIAMTGRSYVDRVRADPRSALAVVDFDAPRGSVEHVGMRGRTTVEPFDPELADRLLATYLGPDREGWDERFRGLDREGYAMLRFDPERVVARDQSFDGSL